MRHSICLTLVLAKNQIKPFLKAYARFEPYILNRKSKNLPFYCGIRQKTSNLTKFFIRLISSEVSFSHLLIEKNVPNFH